MFNFFKFFFLEERKGLSYSKKTISQMFDKKVQEANVIQFKRYLYHWKVFKT
jgi:hypothetical protein